MARQKKTGNKKSSNGANLWSKLRNNAKQPAIGKLIDDAMIAIETDTTQSK